MGNIIKAKFGKAAQRERVKRSSLCQNGHHQWLVDKKKQFDVKQGKLVTLSRCSKCGKTRSSLD
jgi:hypothetical protein